MTMCPTKLTHSPVSLTNNMMSFLPLTVKQKLSGKPLPLALPPSCGVECEPAGWSFSCYFYDYEDKGLIHRDRRAEGKVESGSPVLIEAATPPLNCLTSDFISFKRNEPNKLPLISGSQRAALGLPRDLKIIASWISLQKILM